MKFEIKEIFAVFVPYLIAVEALYLFGFWGAFDINVLEFASFSDISKLAVYPLMVTLVILLSGVLLGELVNRPYFPPGGGAETKIGVFGRKHWRWLIAALIGVTVLIGSYGREPEKWIVVAMLVSFLAIPLSHAEMFVKLIPNSQVRYVMLYLLLLLPPSSFAQGRQHAFSVKAGTSEQFVDVTRSKLPLTCDAKNAVAYLGFLGNAYVLREAKTGAIIFVKQRDDSPLFLSPKPQCDLISPGKH